MKAIRVAKYGGPEELQLQELPPPKPGAGEVLVRVQAAGVNYADIYFATARCQADTVPVHAGNRGSRSSRGGRRGSDRAERGDRVAYASTSGAGGGVSVRMPNMMS